MSKLDKPAASVSRRTALKGLAAAGAAGAGLGALPGFVPYIQAQSSAPIRIGFQVHRTGIGAAYGRWYDRTTQAAARLINEQGGILDGGTLTITSADGACDATAAANATDRLVNTDQVTAIVGGLCTGETIGGANSAAIPGGVVMVSPASTAPALTTLEDNDLVFRTTPSDAFQGQKLAELLLSKDITEIALTYVNNDYGSGFASAVTEAYEAGGGTIAANLAHEDGKADYRAELGNLASSGAETLVATMKADGARCVLVSGGFTYFTERIAKAAGFDTHQGNTLLDDGTSVTGLVSEPILGREAKLAALEAERTALGLAPAETLAMGDGANDLAMIEAAGLGVAYRAKPVVSAAADCGVSVTDLTAVLYFQGFTDSEIVWTH